MEGFLILLLIAAPIVYGIYMGMEANRKLKILQEEYQTALDALKASTTKQNRIAALEAGRALAAHCRESQKVAIFDEVALQNDLQAYGGEEDK